MLLQDLAILQPKFPKMRLFSHRLFEMPEWAEFMAIIQVVEAAHIEEPRSILLGCALPEINNSLHGTRDAVLLSLSMHQAFVKHELAAVKASMQHLHDNMSRQAFTIVSMIRSSIQVSPLTLSH